MKTKLTKAQELSGSDVSLHLGSKILDKLHIPPKDKGELASNLVTLRTEANISQGDLAEIFSVSQSAVGNWESIQTEGRLPPPYAVMMLATLFDCPLEALVLAGDPMIDRLNSQLRAILKIKAHSCSTYEIRELFKTPVRLNKLTADYAQNTRDVRQLECTVTSLLTDVNRLKIEMEQLKQRDGVFIQSQVALHGNEVEQDANAETVSLQSSIYSLPFGKKMEDMGFDLTGKVKHQTVVIAEPMLLLDTTYANVQPSIAAYDPDVTDLEALDGKLAVVENSFGTACVREIRNVRGKFFACAVTALGTQEMQDIGVQKIKVLGKLTALTRVIHNDA